MPIGLPPVDVYAASAFANFTVPVTDDAKSVTLGSSTVSVVGATLLSSQEIRRSLEGRSSAPQAADALADAYERAGWRNVLVVPVETSALPTLVVYEGGLSQVRGYEPFLPYFKPFVGEAPIRYSSFAIAAQLAEMHAARIGSNAEALYGRSTDEPAKVTMNLGGDRRHGSAFDYQMRVGNEGNRFVGRWFGGLDAIWTADSSARLGLSYNRVLPELGDARGDPRYDGYTVFTDRITRFGLVKLLASYADYQYRGIGADNLPLGVEAIDPEFQASNFNLGAQAEHLLHVTPSWRWSAAAGLTHNDYEIEQLGTARFATERSTSAHVGGGGRWNSPASSMRPQVHFDAQARLSIDDTFENSDATKGYSVHSYGGGISAAPFGISRLSLTYEGQWSGSALPQSEQWVLGGFDRLSAWLPGVAVGDLGTFAQLALSIPLVNDEPHDLGMALSLERGTAQLADQSSRLDSRLSSASLAMTYRYSRNWRLEGRVGLPLEEDAPDGFAIDDRAADFYVRAARSFSRP